MSGPGRTRLLEVLGSEPPRGLTDAATDAELERVAEAITDVLETQRRELAQAGDQALAVLPRVLRGPVRKIAGGSR